MAQSTRVSILGKDTIVVGYNLVDNLVKEVLTDLPSSTYVIVTDTHLADLHLNSFVTAFASHTAATDASSSTRLLSYVVPPGEASKSRHTKAAIEDWMLEAKCTRDTVVLALGGGVIGDMVGFVAATFMRGIKIVQIPTTLLSMVDSSIGGKTAIDTPNGKNLVGAFWQPSRIFVDLAFLETLPEREFINGMAEIIKTAAFWDEKEFERLEKNVVEFTTAFKNRNAKTGHVDLSSIKQVLHDLVVGSIKVKAYVVTADEREGGLRNILNFGHSIGHAYEAILTPQILHGECVAIGMVKEAELSRYLGLLSDSAVARLTKILVAYGLPISVNDSIIRERTHNRATPVDQLIKIMAVDKKNVGSKKMIVLLTAIGKTFEPKASAVSDDAIKFILAPDALLDSAGLAKDAKIDVIPPGSKSITNRALILAALSSGVTNLYNLLRSDDTEHMMNALSNLSGANFAWKTGKSGEDVLQVSGHSGNIIASGDDIFLGNSGTSSRFLAAVVTLAKSSAKADNVVLTGNARMKQRPIGALVDALKSNGAHIDYLETVGSLPIRVEADKHLEGGRVELAATVSSQYVSALLMAAPYASSPITLALVGGKPVSQPYIDMTITMMRSFGVDVTRSKTEENTYVIPSQAYVAPAEYVIESDASSATYPLAFAAITGTTVTVPNIGSSSLQGDAKFAVDVLRPMGCEVVQTETSTTVTGPSRGTTAAGQLRSLPLVDMEPMTDAFLTASVLAAVATGTTQIIGIANQRVKECDRIAAMVHELTKFGVRARELPDGIEIEGRGSASVLQVPEDGVWTYDDHRVAMSFSLLAVVAPGKVLIKERRCVEKTWPGWWDTLNTTFKVSLAGSEHATDQQQLSIKTKQANNGRSIIVIGMRGAGKTYFGGLIAEALGLKFEDLDWSLENATGKTIAEIIKDQGWQGFRQLELDVLRQSVTDRAYGFTFACGGGIVETPEARDILTKYISDGGIVINVHRDVKLIMEYLSVDKTRPSYVDDLFSVWQRREQWYSECSNFLIYNSELENDNQITKIRKSLKATLQLITGVSTVHDDILRKQRSFFVCLTFPDVTIAMPDIDQLTQGSDLIELRVDLLQSAPNKSTPSLAYVQEQVGIIRKHTSVPILFTVRTISQGGAFPNEAVDDAIELLLGALKLGVEYLDVELNWPESVINQVVAARGFTKLIASNHDFTGSWKWDGPEWQAAWQQVESSANWADAVKFVGFANEGLDNYKLENFRSTHTSKPFIAINMGKKGQLSRVLNRLLTPVTHPLLPAKAAPGQISVDQIVQAAELIGDD
ncbi:EPSP synthase-domain-containing protein [Lipomyces japonicus]|uniref:EPSP synthase-domain-containing protein n=1 Tax=Lipomyces japonicus TaxID=56871 RepID=UPI0034D00446